MVASHQRARARLAAMRRELKRLRADRAPLADAIGQEQAVAAKIRVAARPVASGWLGDRWTSISAGDPRYSLGQHPGSGRVFLRIGEIQPSGGGAQRRGPAAGTGSAGPAADDGIPMMVPLLGAMHLAIDTGVRDKRVAGLFQGILTRLFAALPAGPLRVVAFDPAGLGRVWAPFRELVDAGVITEHATLAGALAEAEEQIRQGRVQPAAPRQRLLLALGGLPARFAGEDQSRLLAIAHAGLAADVTVLVAEWPPKRPGAETPALDSTIQLTARGPVWEAGTPGAGSAFNFPVVLDPAPPTAVIKGVCQPLALHARAESELTFAELLADPPWMESSAERLATPIGRCGRTPHVMRFDDATPHWMVGGRSGSGKTNFLLDVLAGLTVRYGPDQLALYLLDFKEGVSFTEFTPTHRDPTWIPHAVAVGVESDREYGVAVLRALRAEMGRRAGEMKRAGVTNLADLRLARPEVRLPRILAVIDEFQVLFSGNDGVAQQATAFLEEIARKGRSYGVHLVLASQTMSGIEVLYNKIEAIFGQFPMRVALAGGGGVLDVLNKGADGLSIGTAIVNAEGGIAGSNSQVRIPYADPAPMAELRHRLWEHRPRGSRQPSVFVGYAPQHLHHDPTYLRLATDGVRKNVLVGRSVDVDSPTASVALDATPGRHLAVLGPSRAGADVLHAAVTSLAAQHAPGTARFLLAPLVAIADDAVAAARESLRNDGHDCEVVPLASLGQTLARLATFTGQTPDAPTYLAIFGADVASPTLTAVSTESFRPGLDHLRSVIQQGPVHGVHVLGWWRGIARFSADLGESAPEDVACVVALNVPRNDLRNLLKVYDLDYHPRANRALLLDRHADTARLIVPFVREGTVDEDEL
ncbi:MAG: cell division protein FtsK [Dactylosporangium sp.]|nr:cell division protein FtsK [Dactylosporangium sp.]NNJ62760.1 cell division protein FtsK [Dactylosporangium sp.]